MSNSIIYEHPLNERIRIFLRLEGFYLQAQYFRGETSPWDSQSAISAVIEMLSILERNDVRSDLLKELDRHSINLSRLMETPAVDRKRLVNTLDKITFHGQKIQQMNTKWGTECRENDLITSIRQRTLMYGGTCGFDIPALHFWLNQTADFRSESLFRWLNEFKPLIDGITFLLSMLRNSSYFEQKIAEAGFYQHSLDPQHPCQLLRIALPNSCIAYPEVSGSKHRANIRFLSFPETGRPKQINQNIEFDVCFCAI